MDFIRLTGETFIYSVLILLGGITVTGLTILIFSTIGINIFLFCRDWIGIIGTFAAPVVGIYLADAKKSVIENIAPLLAHIFAPILIVVLIAFLSFALSAGKNPFADRDFLISIDLVLLLALALILYIISARQWNEKPALYDWIVLMLIVLALVVDGIALLAIAFRLGSYGISPNKIATLGLNILLLGNLLLLGLRYTSYLRGKSGTDAIEKSQMEYMTAYFFWAFIVAIIFPPIFNFA
jgi:hypothetical protein